MKLFTLRSGDRFHPAVLIGEDALDLVLARDVIPLAAYVPSAMTALLAGGTEGLKVIERVISLARESRAQLEAIGAILPLASAVLGPAVPDSDLVLSGSMNSRGHLLEMGDILPSYPCAFHKVRSAVTASGAQIVPPLGHGEMLDWEGEFCVVIGAPCHNVSVDEAMDYVAGYTLMNDVSARDYVLPFITSKGPSPSAQAWERNVLGKNYPGFAPIGPFILTKDELPTPLKYHMETLLNGEVMQSSTQDDLVFTPAEMISYFSQFYVFAPGDIISMGSPPGVGMARKPQIFMKSGDVIEVSVKEIGTLTNRIAAA